MEKDKRSEMKLQERKIVELNLHILELDNKRETLKNEGKLKEAKSVENEVNSLYRERDNLNRQVEGLTVQQYMDKYYPNR